MSFEGDDYISGWESQLWDMVYYILLKYKTPVQFKEYPGDVRIRMDTDLQWFVPEGPSFEIIESFILNEFKDKIKEGKMINNAHYSIGLNVRVFKYSGVSWYIEKDHLEPMVKNLIDKFMDNIKRRKI